MIYKRNKKGQFLKGQWPKKVIFTCVECGKTEKVSLSVFKTKKLCSLKCKNIYLSKYPPKSSFKLGSIGKRGKDHPNWKGDGIGYSGVHQWIRNKIGAATYCSNDITHIAKRFEWANISGEYKRDIADYKQLCPSCHRKLDYTEATQKKQSINITLYWKKIKEQNVRV